MTGGAGVQPMRVVGWRCLVCAATVEIATPMPWRCPNSTDADRHHALAIVNDETIAASTGTGPPAGSSFLHHDPDLAWAAYAAANGMDEPERHALAGALDDAVAAVAGVGFHITPFARSDALSDALGFTPEGGIWVKDETHAVAGSQKARHLFTILLHLRAAEQLGHLTERPRLAIASCGNAALAAATLAQAANWPIDVYVPTWMSDGFGDELDRLGATIHRCDRRAGDPPGDPAMHRFRQAVAAGAIPFTVQGPENALALDGGRTIGWEIGAQLADGERALDAMYVQVGGGAFAASLGAGLHDLRPTTRLHAVQTEGCAPLERAWRLAPETARDPATAGGQWSSLMYPWDDPQSAADGILDDETYDWLAVFDAMRTTGGSPIVATESAVLAANQLARDAGFDVSVTGSAGLAGVLAASDRIDVTERIGVVMSGIAR